MNRPTRRGPGAEPSSHPLAALPPPADRAGGAPESLDMALAASARGVARAEIRTAFGPEAADLAQVAAALSGHPPRLPAVDALFAARLEAACVQAYGSRASDPRHHRRWLGRPLGLRAHPPSAAEMAVAAAIVLLLGATAVSDSLRGSPALAVTPTSTARDTGTPFGPTSTASHGTPVAMSTAEPVAMAVRRDGRWVGRRATR